MTFQFFSKHWCPVEDRLHFKTLLRFHYKLMSKWTWPIFITWDQTNFAEVPLLMATAHSSTAGSQRAWRGQGPGFKNFYRPQSFSFPVDNLLLPQHFCTLCSTSLTPKCRIMTTALSLDLQGSHSASHFGGHSGIFYHWLPQTLDKESGGSHYLCGLKDREMLLSAVDQPSEAACIAPELTLNFSLHSTAGETWALLWLMAMAQPHGQHPLAARHPLLSWLTAVLLHTCSIYANICSMLDCRLDVFIFKVSWFWQGK